MGIAMVVLYCSSNPVYQRHVIGMAAACLWSCIVLWVISTAAIVHILANLVFGSGSLDFVVLAACFVANPSFHIPVVFVLGSMLFADLLDCFLFLGTVMVCFYLGPNCCNAVCSVVSNLVFRLEGLSAAAMVFCHRTVVVPLSLFHRTWLRRSPE